MYVSVIGVLRKANVTVGYRVLDLDDGRVKDVTTDQLIAVLRNKALTVTNVAVRKNQNAYNQYSLYGIYYSIDLLPKTDIDRAICESSKVIILATVNKLFIGSDCMGHFKVLVKDEVANLLRLKRVINPLDESGRLKCPDASDHQFKFIPSKPQQQQVQKPQQPQQVQQAPKKVYDYSDIKDAKAIWTLDKFSSYMNDNNYSFSIIDYTGKHRVKQLPEKRRFVLCDISPECKIIHLPKGIKSVLNLYDTTNLDTITVDTIIVNSDIEMISAFGNTNCTVNINNVYLQKDESLSASDQFMYTSVTTDYYVPRRHMILTAPAFNKVNVSGDFVVPNNKRIYSLGNNCKINNLVCDTSKNIIDSFNNIEVGNTSLSTGHSEEIKWSFNKVSGIDNLEVTVCIKEIEKSFSDITVKTLDFSKAKRLNRIGNNCFARIHDLEEVDFTECNNLTNLSGSCTFENCTNLHSVKLHPDMAFVREQFSGCPISELELPEKMYHFTWNIPNLHAKLLNKHLNGGIFYNYDESKGHSIDISLVEDIQDRAFSNKRGILTDNVYPNIIKLEKEAFDAYLVQYFNTSCIPSVKEIPDRLFASSEVQEVVFADSVETIGKEVFINCKNISKIALGESIREIDPKFLDKISSPRTIVIYVIEGSYAHKFYKNKKKGIEVIVKKSMDKVLPEFGIDKADLRQNAKYKISIPGSKYEYMLKEPYNKYIAKLMTAAKNFESAEQIPNYELDTSAFIDEDLSNFPELQRHVDNARGTLIYNDENYGTMSNSYDKKEYTKHFASISNMLTKLIPIQPVMYKKEFRDNMGKSPINTKLIYCDNYNVIMYCRTYGVANVEFKWLVIVMGDKIKFMSPFDPNQLSFDDASKLHLLNNKRYDGNITNARHSIGSMFAKGDVIAGSNSTVQGAPMPYELVNAARAYFNTDGYGEPFFNSNAYIYIGGAKRLVRSNMLTYSGLHKKVQLMIYDIISEKFIIMDSNIEYSNNYTDFEGNYLYLPYDVGDSSIREIYDLNDFDKIPDKFFEQIVDAVHSTDNLRVLKANTCSSDELTAIYNKSGAFDVDGNMKLAVFTDQIHIAFKDVNSMLRPGFLAALAELGFIKPFSKSLFDVTGDADFYPNGRLELQDNVHTKIVEFLCSKESTDKFVMGEVNDNTDANARGKLYESIISLKNIATALFEIGEYRAKYKNTREPYNGITDNKVDPARFAFLRSYSHVGTERIKTSVAIDKLNCDIYFIGERWDYDFYTLFRFKNIQDALEIFKKKILCDSRERYNFGSMLETIASNSDIKESTRPLFKLRDLIMDGRPNGYPAIEDEVGIFDMLAKQPHDKIK